MFKTSLSLQNNEEIGFIESCNSFAETEYTYLVNSWSTFKKKSSLSNIMMCFSVNIFNKGYYNIFSAHFSNMFHTLTNKIEVIFEFTSLIIWLLTNNYAFKINWYRKRELVRDNETLNIHLWENLDNKLYKRCLPLVLGVNFVICENCYTVWKELVLNMTLDIFFIYIKGVPKFTQDLN